MKVKDITLREAEVTTKPMPGATELDVNGKPVGVAHDAQTAQMISQAAKDGKLSLGATPDGTQPGQQTNNLGEEPAADNTNTYFVDNSSGKPMVKSGNGMTPVVGSKMWQQITPEILAKAQAQGFRQVYVSVNGKPSPALEGGGKVIVSPNDYTALSGTRNAPQAIRESADLSRIKMLSGL